MTIQDNLNRIQQAKSDIKAAIESKGVYVDEADKIDIYASKIYEIEQGDRFNVVDIIDGAHLYNMVMYEGFAGPAVLKGTITGIDNISPEYNNATYYVDDVIKVYRGNYLEGMSFVNGDELKIGDYVVVRGTASNYNGTPQMDKYSVIEVLKHEPLLGHLYADFEDCDGEGNYWRYGFDDGLDGFNYVKINASNYGTQKYQEGYDQGKSEGGSGLTILPASITFSDSTLTELDMTQWDWSKVKDLSTLFKNNTNLERVVIAPIKPNIMEYIFYGCSNLTNIEGLQNIDTSDVTNMYMAFSTCDNLEYLDVSGWDTSNVTNMSNLFGQCQKLRQIDGLNTWDTSNVTDMSSMFSWCFALENLDLSSWNTSNVSKMTTIFINLKSCKTLNISGWDLSKVNGTISFKSLDALEVFDLTNIKVREGHSTFIDFLTDCVSLHTIHGLEDLDVSNETNMHNFFCGCKSLQRIDLSKWDTSNVTDMSGMFAYCDSLTELIMGGDVSNVYNAGLMFAFTKTTGTLYYNEKYDYSKIIEQLPTTWTAVPLAMDNNL